MSEMIQVSMVANAHATETKPVQLLTLLQQITDGRWKFQQDVIRKKREKKLRETGGDPKAAKAEIKKSKESMPAVTFAGLFSYRNNDGWQFPSGLLPADLDDLDSDLPAVREKLRQSQHLFFDCESVTGSGLRAVFRIPIGTKPDEDRYHDCFEAVRQHVLELCGVEIDPACKDPVRLSFVSADRSARLNPEATPITLLPKAPKAKTSKKAQEKKRDKPDKEQIREMLSFIPKRPVYPDWMKILSAVGDAELSEEDAVEALNEWSPEESPGEYAYKLKKRQAEIHIGTLFHIAKEHGWAPKAVVQWFRRKFPALTKEKFGDPVAEETTEEDVSVVTAISQPYLAATLGDLGSPETPTVYIAEEDRFYRYSKTEGIYVEVRAPEIMAHFADLLWEAARENPKVLTGKLEFGFRDASKLTGPIAHARGCLVKPYDYFDNDLTDYIPCQNGMLRLADRSLLPFNSSYRRRNKLAVRFDPSAKCKVFLETLMIPALEPDDLDLIQRACGLFLIGKNLAQRIILLIGTAGGGKGTFIRVLCGIVGLPNVAALRTHLLTERFETGRFLGKTLLYGADVQSRFLNTPGASVLKMLVGGDPTTFELKGSNERPNIVCYFNAVVSCNSRLIVHLEGDAEAWRRRLAIIDYHKPKPKVPNPKLSDLILANEAPGVLNWMLEGLDKLRADAWQLLLTDSQEKPVNDLLLESDSQTVFVREKLTLEHDSELTVTEAFDAYVKFCNEREWSPATRRQFGGQIGDIILRQFRLVDRNDIKGSGYKALRGWKGLRLIDQPNSENANNDHDEML